MEQYVVGLDGGGTKTAMEVRNLDGNVLLRYEAGGLNYNSNTKIELEDTLKELLEQVKYIDGGLSSCNIICMSTAGISNPMAEGFFRKVIRELGFLGELILVGDPVGALYGYLGKGDGIILISGTGSICYGKNKKGEEFRTGGYGHLIDDEGSGYAIGRDILSVSVRSYDKRIKESILLPMVLHKIGASSIQDMIKYTYQASSKKDIAALAPLLLEAIKEKDHEAIKIGEKASRELVQLVLPVAKHLQLDNKEIGFTGGILTHFHEIRNQVIIKLQEELADIKVVEPKYDSATGAALIALEKIRKGVEING